MSNETMNADAKKHGITIGYITGDLYISNDGIRTDGEMVGVSGLKECATCKWATIAHEPRTITGRTVIINQNGGRNIDCHYRGSKDIDMRGDEMKCSAWEETTK